VTEVQFPEGYRLEPLSKKHSRRDFRSGESLVDDWLRTKAVQHQQKHLSATKVLVDAAGAVVGVYTLATGQVDFSDLPPDITRKLPRRALPVAVLAWLGVSQAEQGKGIGQRLLARALRDAYEAGQTFAFVAVILDCVSDSAKLFYQRWDFEELPGQPYRLFLSASRLAELIERG
jgi:GNAT superfamily N-acetyltransferase